MPPHSSGGPALLVADGLVRFGQHDREDDGDADRADVDENFHQGQERAVEEIVKPGQADAADRQAAHAPDDARGQGGDERAHDRGRDADEEDCADDHLGGGKRVI